MMIYTPTTGPEMIPVVTAWLNGQALEYQTHHNQTWFNVIPYCDGASFPFVFSSKVSFRIIETTVAVQILYTNGCAARLGTALYGSVATARDALINKQIPHAFLVTTVVGDKYNFEVAYK